MRLNPAFLPIGLLMALAILPSCRREPPLHLVDPDPIIDFETNKIILDLEVLWEYEISYDWQAEWWYDWDQRDDTLFGSWDLQQPSVYNIRRYFTGQDPDAKHTQVLPDQTTEQRYQATYKYGYYDILVWNDVNTMDGVQSLHFDEQSSLEYVMAYTNQSNQQSSVPNSAPAYRGSYAFYQPEFLFSGKFDDLHVTDDPADYDSLIVNLDGSYTWYKFVPLLLTPVTYIYLPQVVMHNNYGSKVTGVDGNATLTGMARSVNLTTHITSAEDISVGFSTRMKRHADYVDPETQEHEDVDIVGGRLFTFGLTGIDPFQVTRSSTSYQDLLDSPIRNYLEVSLQFNNGYDSLFVFDVTDQVKERYKGGVITVHLDVEKIPLPTKGDGSFFDAVVEEFEEETHEFEVTKK